MRKQKLLFSPRGRVFFRQRMLRRMHATNSHTLERKIISVLRAHVKMVSHSFRRVLLYGYPGPQALAAILDDFPNVVLADVALPSGVTGLLFVATDLDVVPFAPNSFDLIINVMTLHLSNDIPGVLRQMNVCLAPDGLCVNAFWGGESLVQLKRLWISAELELYGGVRPRFMPQTAPHHGAMLMQRAGFHVCVCQTSRYTLRLRPSHVTDQAHQWGQWAPFQDQPAIMNKRILNYLDHKYADMNMTFQVLYLSGRAPSQLQQKPLSSKRALLSY